MEEPGEGGGRNKHQLLASLCVPTLHISAVFFFNGTGAVCLRFRAKGRCLPAEHEYGSETHLDTSRLKNKINDITQ